jgi:CCR4-NOT transcription complex subunit 11
MPELSVNVSLNENWSRWKRDVSRTARQQRLNRYNQVLQAHGESEPTRLLYYFVLFRQGFFDDGASQFSDRHVYAQLFLRIVSLTLEQNNRLPAPSKCHLEFVFPLCEANFLVLLMSNRFAEYGESPLHLAESLSGPLVPLDDRLSQLLAENMPFPRRILVRSASTAHADERVSVPSSLRRRNFAVPALLPIQLTAVASIHDDDDDDDDDDEDDEDDDDDDGSVLPMRYLTPDFIRRAPPVLAIDDADSIWLFEHSFANCAPLDDSDESASSSSSSSSSSAAAASLSGKAEQEPGVEVEMHRLMMSACERALHPDKMRRALAILKESPGAIFSSGLTPGRLPRVVEHNANLAVQCLLLLISSPSIADYFAALVDMDLSLNSLEMVNQLTAMVEIPEAFLHLYMSNCMSSCVNVRELNLQRHLVRLVCVFVQSLVRNCVVDVRDLHVELSAFCIEFASVPEATALFHLLNK